MHKQVLLGVTGLMHLRNKDILSRQLLTMQLMVTKVLKILLTLVVLLWPIVHQQVRSRFMLSQHQVSQVMINQSHNLVVLELYQQVLRLLMVKLCRLSLFILSMIQPKYMVRLVKI